MPSTAAPPVIRATLPGPLDPRWSRLPGLHADGTTVTLDPGYWFRFENPSWTVCDWAGVRDDLLPAAETSDQALEQTVLDYIRAHGRATDDPAEVLATAWHVYAHLFRDDLLPVAGPGGHRPGRTEDAPRGRHPHGAQQGRTDGHITNISPTWFFGAAIPVVFDLDEQVGQIIDQAYHGTWFNEPRRIESVKAHAALGGRLVHGCQSDPNLSGGVVAPYGTDISVFRDGSPGCAKTGSAPSAGPPHERNARRMTEAPAPRLLPATLSHAGWPPDTAAELVRQARPYSGVWRLRQPGGGTAIYKEAWKPLDREHGALVYARSMGLPVPQVLAAVQRDDRAGIIMTDLGQPDREATGQDAATIAAALHRIPAAGALPGDWSRRALAAMPARIAARARKHDLPAAVPELAARLDAIAGRIATAAAIPPVGLCHSEFHPTSVIIQGNQWHTYDLARAFHGPGPDRPGLMARHHHRPGPGGHRRPHRGIRQGRRPPRRTGRPRRAAARAMGARMAPHMGRRLVLPAT